MPDLATQIQEELRQALDELPPHCMICLKSPASFTVPVLEPNGKYSREDRCARHTGTMRRVAVG